MSVGLLDLSELSVRSGVPAACRRHCAEAGLLPPARRDPLPDNPDGVALRVPFDVDLAGLLGRLAAAVGLPDVPTGSAKAR